MTHRWDLHIQKLSGIIFDASREIPDHKQTDDLQSNTYWDKWNENSRENIIFKYF